ncbi:MAG TPA: hypothetical protein VEP90_25095 [Methylomirabilota bacterium]|nr:hypothetical protein [Methylomirabilota bacterium]
MENALERSPEAPEHVLEISKWVTRYAKGDISLEEYQFHFNSWCEKNREAWKENDLATLFLICCFSE